MAHGTHRPADWRAGDWNTAVTPLFDQLKKYDDALATATLAPELRQRLF